MINIGDVVRIKEPWLPYTEPDSDLGLVIDHMPPFAKSMEPYGLYRVLWSGKLENLNHSDSLDDDAWFSPEDLECVIKAFQRHIE